MIEVVIRHSKPSDLAGVKSIYEQEHAYSNSVQLPYPSDAYWESNLGNTSDNKISLVAVAGNDIAGQLTLIVSERPRRKHVATLGMGVLKKYTRNGIGSKLVTAALDLADNWLRIRRIELEVYSDNESAINLYKKFSFEVEGECRQYAFKNGHFVDALIMARFTDN